MNPPDRIYLQVDPEDERLQRHEGVTWSKGKVFETDVEYIRVDLHEEKMEENDI